MGHHVFKSLVRRSAMQQGVVEIHQHIPNAPAGELLHDDIGGEVLVQVHAVAVAHDSLVEAVVCSRASVPSTFGSAGSSASEGHARSTFSQSWSVWYSRGRRGRRHGQERAKPVARSHRGGAGLNGLQDGLLVGGVQRGPRRHVLLLVKQPCHAETLAKRGQAQRLSLVQQPWIISLS